MSARVWIKEQLIRVEPMARFWFVGPVYAVAVNCSRRDFGQVSVPDLVRIFGEFDPLYFSLLRIEQAHLNLRGVGGEQRKISPLPIPRGTTRKRISLFDLYFLGR